MIFPKMCPFPEPQSLYLYHRLDTAALSFHSLSHLFPPQVQPDGVTLEYNPYSWNLV